MTYTPGKWEVHKDGPITSVIVSHADPNSYSLICDVFSNNKLDDAYLIAGASDLLEACKETFRICELNGDLENYMAMLQDAIAKAEWVQS